MFTATSKAPTHPTELWRKTLTIGVLTFLIIETASSAIFHRLQANLFSWANSLFIGAILIEFMFLGGLAMILLYYINNEEPIWFGSHRRQFELCDWRMGSPYDSSGAFHRKWNLRTQSQNIRVSSNRIRASNQATNCSTRLGNPCPKHQSWFRELLIQSRPWREVVPSSVCSKTIGGVSRGWRPILIPYWFHTH